MTTLSNSAIFDQSNVTAFRVWGKEMSDSLTTVGFPKSADTGQINWATATMPAANASSGYEIRYLNDSLFSTAPIYVKLEFGAYSTTTIPQMWITVGKGTDGAGNITGVLIPRLIVGIQAAITSITTPYPSYYSCSEGFIGCAFKYGAYTQSGTVYCGPSFILSRSCDDSGVPNGDGIIMYPGRVTTGSYSAYAISVNYASGYSAQSNGNQVQAFPGYTFVPYALTTSIVSGSPAAHQVLRHWHVLPLIRPVFSMITTIIGDAISIGATVQCAPVGTTPRTFISLWGGFGNFDRLAMLWE